MARAWRPLVSAAVPAAAAAGLAAAAWMASSCSRRETVAPVPTESASAHPSASVVASGAVEDASNDAAPKIIVTSSDDYVLEQVYFSAGSSTLGAASKPVVAEMARMLVGHPSWFVLVEGHADDPGSTAAQIALSEARADALRTALVAEGARAAQLLTKGFGPHCPMDPSGTPFAHEKNRRCELRILATTEGATGVATGCPAASAKGLSFTPPVLPSPAAPPE
jgi:outer membrane protein OmpA-like peptidoglycan-associated protein